MADYGAMAQEHWARWLPTRYSSIPNPELFFRELGEEVEKEIDSLALELEGADPHQESYLDRVGRMKGARQRAEQIVLQERVRLDPEPGADPDEEPTAPPATEPGLALPLVVGPEDPEYQQILEEEQRAQETLRRGSDH
ncbi:hypothetical protein GCM10009772_50510 [Pseudonocardia alni subsp. carboxydivorans]|uniref:TnpV protein n=1 Tax=Pseudonocardia alni subsp. carboxydivorans TaxID=415010 RepID=A0ABU9AM44_PSEA5